MLSVSLMTDQTSNQEQGVSSVPAQPQPKTGPGAGIRILVVEDDRFLRGLLTQKLDNEGFDVSIAADGNEGMEKIAQEKPDVVLLDIILPGIDGFEILKKMQADPELSKIPIMLLTNLGQQEDIERGLRLGAKGYLIKAHFTPSEIVDKIKAVIKESYL